MSALIKDVLTYSRLIKSEKLFTPTDLAKVFKDILEDFELLIAEKQATITFPVLPVMNGNPVQLNQLFSNLLSNALKFSDKNPLIDLSFRPLLNGEASKYPELDIHKKYIHFIFKDNGIGFNPKYAEQVFKLFQRLNQTEKGNGIGLAVCKKVVENHGGHISVASKPGEGTSFHIFLPA
jgi:signal transduction histidine kinase